MVETHCSLMIHQFLIIDQNIFPRNLPDCTVLSNWFFDNSILAAKLSGKALWRIATCLSVSNNLCGKLVSSLESTIIFDERFKVSSVPFFGPDFKLWIGPLEI